MPEKVLEYVVKALSSAVKREKYMGNVYYTPWKVAMGVQNLAAMHALNLQPISTMDAEALALQPPNSTDCPFEVAPKVELKGYARYADGVRV